MTRRYIIRTIDEDWIDCFDEPSRIDDKHAAWEEAKRRVVEYPELWTVVINRHNGSILWKSDPDIPPRYEVVSTPRARFDARASDDDVAVDTLSSHKEKDDAWTAFYDAVAANPVAIVLMRHAIALTIVAHSDNYNHLRPTG